MLSKDTCNELYTRYAPGAFRRAQRLLGNSLDANDVVHDVFLALLERYEQFRGDSAHGTYVYAAVTHACLNRLRDRQRRERLTHAHTPLLGPSRDSGAHTESWVAARALLERLPEPLAEVAVYYYCEELSLREIAGLLGCSHAHVATLVERLTRWIDLREPVSCRA